MSLIHEALKRAEAERTQDSYSPPPIDKPEPKVAVPRARQRSKRFSGRWVGILAAGCIVALCAGAATWAVMAFAGSAPGPQPAWGLDTRIPAREVSPDLPGRPESVVPDLQRSTPRETVDQGPTCSDTPQESQGQPEVNTYPQPRNATGSYEPEPNPLITLEQWEQMTSASNRAVAGVLEDFAAIGPGFGALCQDLGAFVRTQKHAQYELALEAQRRREIERKKREEAGLAAEKARADQLAQQKAQAQKQEQLRKQAQAKREQELRAQAEARRQEELRKQELARREEEARRRQEQESSAVVTAGPGTPNGSDAQASSDGQEPEFILNAILLSYERTYAVINNKAYRLNETVNGAKVIHIERTMAKLLYKGKVIVLRL